MIATGGLARMVADHTDAIDTVDSELILEGLVLIYRAYRKGPIHEIKDKNGTLHKMQRAICLLL